MSLRMELGPNSYDITVEQVEKALKVKVRIIPQNGEEMLRELIR